MKTGASVIEALECAMSGFTTPFIEAFDTETDLEKQSWNEYTEALKAGDAAAIEDAANGLALARRGSGFLSGFRMGFRLCMEVMELNDKPTDPPARCNTE